METDSCHVYNSKHLLLSTKTSRVEGEERIKVGRRWEE